MMKTLGMFLHVETVEVISETREPHDDGILVTRVLKKGEEITSQSFVEGGSLDSLLSAQPGWPEFADSGGYGVSSSA